MACLNHISEFYHKNHFSVGVYSTQFIWYVCKFLIKTYATLDSLVYRVFIFLIIDTVMFYFISFSTVWPRANISHDIRYFYHDDVIKWKHFPRNWPFVRGIHRPRWIPHTKASDAELWCFLWSCVWIKGWVNNREAGYLRRHHGHYDVM